MCSPRAISAVPSEVGTPMILSPSATLRPIAPRACLAVEPVPSPTSIPSFNCATAATAACSFKSSGVMLSRFPFPPADPNQIRLRIDVELHSQLVFGQRSVRQPVLWWPVAHKNYALAVNLDCVANHVSL